MKPALHTSPVVRPTEEFFARPALAFPGALSRHALPALPRASARAARSSWEAAATWRVLPYVPATAALPRSWPPAA